MYATQARGPDQGAEPLDLGRGQRQPAAVRCVCVSVSVCVRVCMRVCVCVSTVAARRSTFLETLLAVHGRILDSSGENECTQNDAHDGAQVSQRGRRADFLRRCVLFPPASIFAPLHARSIFNTFQPNTHTPMFLPAGPSSANRKGEAWTAPPALLTPVTSTKRLVLWERSLFGWQGQLHDLGALRVRSIGLSDSRLSSESMSMRWSV